MCIRDRFGAPAVGSDVVILFQSGDPHYPVYVSGIQLSALEGFVSGVNWGFVDPKGNRLNVNLSTGSISFAAAAGVVFNISADGNLSVTSKSAASIKAPRLTIEADVAISGSLTNNGVNVGSAHVHSGVATGGAVTEGPQ